MKCKNGKIQFDKIKFKKLVKELKERNISFMISTDEGLDTLIIDAKVMLDSMHPDVCPEITDCVFVLNYCDRKFVGYHVKVQSFRHAIADFIQAYNIFHEGRIKIYGGKKLVDYQLVDSIYKLDNKEYSEVKRYLEGDKNKIRNKAQIGFTA